MLQDPIARLVTMGTLPSEENATVEQVALCQTLIEAIKTPISNEEAMALCAIFGNGDSLFGLKWTLVHHIEKAPGWPIRECLADTTNEWLAHLRHTARNGGFDV